jgi:hypothetical protein
MGVELFAAAFVVLLSRKGGDPSQTHLSSAPLVCTWLFASEFGVESGALRLGRLAPLRPTSIDSGAKVGVSDSGKPALYSASLPFCSIKIGSEAKQINKVDS